MRTLFLHVNVTLDGFIEGPNREIDWHFADREFEAYSNRMLRSIDAIVLGRVAYELFAAYWPTAAQQPGASAEQVESAGHLNRLPKYVLTSRGCDTSRFANSHLLGRDWPARLAELKRAPGRGIALFGGAQAARAVLEAGLVDELHLLVNPLVLGGGTALFDGATRRPMELLGLERFASGAVLLRYRPRATVDAARDR